MHFLRHLLDTLKSTPVFANNMSTDTWCRQMCTQSPRYARKVEICTALTAGDDAWGMNVGDSHLHTLLRVFLAPTATGPYPENDVLLIERVLSTGGAYHSVTPISEQFPENGTLFHPDVHDRVCAISEGPSTALAHHLEVERTLEFGNDPFGPRLTLAQMTQILDLISQTTKLICAGGECKFQSRTFAFTFMAALTPRLPPSMPAHKGGNGMGTNIKHEANMMDDSIIEESAEAFLKQVPSLVLRDPITVQTVGLMLALKECFDS